MDINEFRSQYPPSSDGTPHPYNQMDDAELAAKLYAKFYTKVDPAWFRAKFLGSAIQPPPLPETPPEPVTYGNASVGDRASKAAQVFGDAIATVASGMVIDPAARIAGLGGQWAGKQAGAENPREWGKAAENWVRGGQYETRTPEAREALTRFGEKEPTSSITMRGINALSNVAGRLGGPEDEYFTEMAAPLALMAVGGGKDKAKARWKGMKDAGLGEAGLYGGDLAKTVAEARAKSELLYHGAPSGISKFKGGWVTPDIEYAKRYAVNTAYPGSTAADLSVYGFSRDQLRPLNAAERYELRIPEGAVSDQLVIKEGAIPRRVMSLQDATKQNTEYPPGSFSNMADKKLRWEIDDSRAELKNVKYDPKTRTTEYDKPQTTKEFFRDFFKGAKVKDILDHPKLFREYPEIAEWNIGFGTEHPTTLGGTEYKGKTIWLNWNRTPEQIKASLIHELNHAVGKEQGFAPGGTLEESGSVKGYRNIAGEIESRDAAARMNLTPDQRMHTGPYTSEDIPLDQWIVRNEKGKGGVAASVDNPEKALWNKEHSNYGMVDTDAATLISERNKSDHVEFLTPYTPEELSGATIKKLPDLEVGYVIKPDKDIVNVYNNTPHKGLGAVAVIDAVQRGGKTLDCVDGYLTKLYKSLGFEEYNRVPWDEKYAPNNWNYGEYGTPDVVFLKHGGETNVDNIRRSYEARWNRKLDADPVTAKVLAGINRRTTSAPSPGVVLSEPSKVQGGTKASVQRSVAPPTGEGGQPPSLSATPKFINPEQSLWEQSRKQPQQPEHKVFNELDADTPFIRNMLDEPEYHRRAKGMETHLVWMSPSEYIAMSAKMKKSPVEREINTANLKTISKYAREMRRLQREGGEPFPALWIEAHRGNQEGRHRALAAQDVGIKKVPVYIVTKVKE